MPFAFAWEQPAAAIGAVAVLVAAGAGVFAVARAHHGPSQAELAALGLLAAVSVWTFDARIVLAKRLFPDGTDLVEERVGEHMRAYGDCAAYVEKIGKGTDDGAVCTVRVFSVHGRYVAPVGPPALQESPCDVTATPMARIWRFENGAVQDWCAR